MAKVTLLADGIKLAKASGMNRNPPKRGLTKGWTSAVARRNQTFLQSIDAQRLDGEAVSASLTLGPDADVTPKQFADLRAAFFQRLRRFGLLRLHWVMEFQSNGRPHLHLLAFFHDCPANAAAAWMQVQWLQLTSFTGASVRGQHSVAVHNLTGWKKYLAKHGARSAEHHQRAIQEGPWANPGRMWGKIGDWPVTCNEFETDADAFHWLRRRLRSWRVADAKKDLRKAKTPEQRKAAVKRLQRARGMLTAKTRQMAELRGANEWMKGEAAGRLLAYMADQGAMVRDWAQRFDNPTQPPRPALSTKGRRDGGA